MQDQSVFILRMKTLGESRVQQCLEADRIVIGWAHLPDLIGKAENHYELRAILEGEYGKGNRLGTGRSAGILRRFLHEMQVNDFVLVPSDRGIYLARVTGDPDYDPKWYERDAAYYRPVEWLNDKAPFARNSLPSDVQHHAGYGTRITCREVRSILPHVREMETGAINTDTSFEQDLRKRVSNAIIAEIKEGRMNPTDFERFLENLFRHCFNAKGSARRRGKSDKGADIVLDIEPPHELLDHLSSKVAVQAKYYREKLVGTDAVDQVVRGMKEEDADLGLVVTTGKFSEEATKRAEEVGVVCVDGELLAEMIGSQLFTQMAG